MNQKDLKKLLERCDDALFTARRAGMKLWTAYVRKEVSPRNEYDCLIKISENSDSGGTGEISALISDLRKMCHVLEKELPSVK